MALSRARIWAMVLPAAALVAMPLRAQQQPASAGSVSGPAAQTSSRTALLGVEDLDRLIGPFAGAPQDTLGVVLDACRYPNDLLEAARWTQQPEGTRGAARDTWPPTVRLLAERAPRTLDFLARDLANTSALGSAYQNQPNDVWLSYGRVTARQTHAEAGPDGPPAPSAPARAAGAERPAAGPSPAPSPVPAPRPAQNPSAAANSATGPPQQPSEVVVAQPPPASGPSAAGAAIVGGVVGLGAGLLISELARDNDGWGYGHSAPYAVPPPYMPYAGGGGAYNATRGLQDSRQAAARELQGNRQSFAAAGREDRQGFAAEQRQQRQAAESQRQAQRQTAHGDRQAQRQQSSQASGIHGAAAGGAHRRDLATAGQSRSGQRGVSAQRVASAHPGAQGGAQRAGWGPAQGMSGDRLAGTRARQPPAGGGLGAHGGHPGRRR